MTATTTTPTNDSMPMGARWATPPVCGYFSVVSDASIGLPSLTSGTCASGQH